MLSSLAAILLLDCGIFSSRQHMPSALYAIARPSVCPYVCLSVRRVYHRKTVEG